ncbi:MAG: hypothetical protein H7177_16810 [Rhizobacter sp.]|nr:hypothetical protein [Bacteriovorax sp.]
MKKLLLICSLIVSNNAFAAHDKGELVLNTESTYNPTHDNRFSFMAGFNSSLQKSSDLSNFAFSYAKQMDHFWIDSNVVFTKGLFREMSANNPKATGAMNDQIELQQNNLTTIGVGIGRETRYAQTLLPFDGIYELMAADLTYNSYKEDYSGKTFTGPGLLAKFSLYKRFNDYFSAGAHFNYNLAVVKRAKENEESSSDRSLTLGFLTIGFELSFFL